MTTLYSLSIHSSHPQPPTPPPTHPQPLFSRHMRYSRLHNFPPSSSPLQKEKKKKRQLEQKEHSFKNKKKKGGWGGGGIKVSGERKRALRRLGMSLSAMVVRPSYWEEAVSRAGLLLSAGPSVFPHHHLSGLQSLRALPALCICCRTGWPFFQHCWNGYSVDQSALVVLRQYPHSSTVS